MKVGKTKKNENKEQMGQQKNRKVDDLSPIILIFSLIANCLKTLEEILFLELNVGQSKNQETKLE